MTRRGGSGALVATGLLVAVGVLALAGPAQATSTGATAWGDNEHGQLGDGTTGEGNDSPVAVAGLSGVTAVAAGNGDGMALLVGGTVMAWGNNGHGQLGDGDKADSDVPVEVTGLSEVGAISAGGYHNLALLSSGNVMAWGDNYRGQLGDGNETDSDVPVKVNALSGVKFVSAGGAHSLALLNDGKVMAWGWNEYGQMGDGTTTDSDVPVEVAGLSEVAAVAAGEAHSLALLKDGNVMAWGDDYYGQLGDGQEVDSDVPVEVRGLSEVMAVATGGSHSLALLKDGRVMAWGDNEYGQLGDGGEGRSSDVPVEVAGLSEVAAIAAGGKHSLALLKDGRVMVWGDNEFGQLGDDSEGRSSSSDVPVEVAGLSEVTAIAGGDLYSLAASSPPKPFPTLTSVEPGYGSPAGGTHVTITGTNFSEVSAVRFGSSNAASFKVESDTKITAVAPAGTGAVHVTVTTAKGGNSPIGSPDDFDYRPAVTTLEPGYGAPAGGTHVTITGTNFNEVSTVEFGSRDAARFKVESETKIIAVAPAGTGTVDVTVTTAGGTSSTGFADNFDYRPSVSKLEPSYGSPSGGTHVTIAGTNFNEVSAVKFGSTAAMSFEVVSENTINAVAPAGTGVVDATVTSPGGISSKGPSDDFDYGPTITRVTPEHGTPTGGTGVTITGTNFTGATEVKFGSNNARSFKVESGTEITAVTPAFSGGAEDGVGVYITTPGGTNTSEECGYPVGYRYEPAITKVEPDSGSVAGGMHVTIRGAAFEGTDAGGGLLCSLLKPVVQSVKFGSKEATHWSIVSDTEITAVAPAGSSKVDVTIESVVGTSPIISADQFSYNEAPEAPIMQCDPLVIPGGGPFVCGTLNPHSKEKLTGAYLAFEAGAICTGAHESVPVEGFTGQGEEDIEVRAKPEGLAPGTEYAFCLVAGNSSGGTASDPLTFTTTAEPRSEPPTAVTSTSATLEGTLEPAGAKLKYQFYYSKGPTCEGGAGTAQAEGENKVSAQIEGLTSNTEYTFCLEAKGDEGGFIFQDETSVGTVGGAPVHFKTLESPAEKKAEEKVEQEAKAKAEAEVTAQAEAKARAEAEAVAARKNQEEAAAAAKRQQEEEAARKRAEEAKSKAKHLTRAERLAKALKQCKKEEPRRKRAKCEAAARKKYGSRVRAKRKWELGAPLARRLRPQTPSYEQRV